MSVAAHKEATMNAVAWQATKVSVGEAQSVSKQTKSLIHQHLQLSAGKRKHNSAASS
eukprot:m.34511 g.34511  ORF g.34511 m.34511 type:complete len:57 (-) comp9771_c0_seq1:2107-2277(-)